MSIWKRILNGKKAATSAEVEKEIESLEDQLSETTQRKKALEEKLSLTDQDILAGDGKIKDLEPIQRELENVGLRIRTIEGVLSNLNKKLYTTRQAEIKTEIAEASKEIDEKEASKAAIKKKLAHHLAMAGILYRDLTGDNPENVNSEFFNGKRGLPAFARNEEDISLYTAALKKNGLGKDSLHQQIDLLEAARSRCYTKLEDLDKDFGIEPYVKPEKEEPKVPQQEIDLRVKPKKPAFEFTNDYDGTNWEGVKKPGPHQDEVELSGHHVMTANSDPAQVFVEE